LEQIDIKQLTKLYYTIGEVADMFSVNTSLIRFWEKEFNLIQPKKSKKGNRMFTPKDIENFNKIYHLVKTNGYTLEGAKKALKSKQTVNDSIDLKDSKDLNNSTKMNENNDSLVQKLEEIKQKLIRLKNEQ
jgi:DNA-binding transcriptional MerR regulator